MEKKIREYIKDNKQQCIGALVILIILILTLIQNLWTRYLADDWCYMFVYDHMGNPNESSRRVKTIFDVIVSMKNHWRICNGRVVAHGLLQLVLSTSYPAFHKVIFNIVNSLMYALLGFVIYKHCTYRKKDSLLLLLGIYAMLWLYLPQYGITVLWASGAANYLWCTVIMLLYLMPYTRYAQNPGEAMPDTRKNIILMAVLGLFAGCTNENTGGALALMCILLVLSYKLLKIKIPKWSLAGIATTIIGVIVLISAPGNYRIDSKTDLQGLIDRGKEVISTSKELLFPIFAILCVVLFLVWVSRLLLMPEGGQESKERQTVQSAEIILPIIYTIGAVASIAVMIFSALRPERTWFLGTSLLILLTGYMFMQTDFSAIHKNVFRIASVILCIVLAVSYVTEFKKLYTTYEQVHAEDKIINEARKSSGSKEIYLDLIVPSDSKHDAMFYTGNFSTNGNEWDNSWASLYYGLDKITAVDAGNGG